MEARIIAEDPAAQLHAVAWGASSACAFPQGPGVRNDAGVYRGYEVPVFYDSLLAKLVVWGTDREQARRRLLRALDEFVLEGPHHNLAFHRWLVAHPEFVAGQPLDALPRGALHARRRWRPAPEATEVAVLAAALHAREERERVALPAEARARRRRPWRWAERAPAAGARR